MKDLWQALEEKKFDTRLQDYNVQQGQVRKADLEKHLGQLPDMSGQVEQLTLEDRDYDNGH